MQRRVLRAVGSCLLALSFTVLASRDSAAAVSSSKPKVRAITGFVRLDHAQYERQIADALTVLKKAQSEFEASGYQIESVRITTQPLAELVTGLSDQDAMAFLKALDDLSAKQNFLLNVGPAMMRDADDPKAMRLLTQALSTLPNLNASSIIAADDGMHWKVIRETATLIRYVSEHSQHSQGNFNFTATAMLMPYSPFFPGSYHTGAGKQFSIGFEGASVVQEVFAQTHGNMSAATEVLTRELTRHAQVADAIGRRVESATSWKYMGVDPTPAPLADVSIGAAIEAYTGARFGASGTLTAALIITSAVKAVTAKQIGYSGLMVPVMEDKRLAQRWAEGTYDVDSLLAYSAVCGTGLDTIPLPGDITEEQLQKILGDVASLAWKWHKPLSARLLPVQGKKSGDQTDFNDPYLFNTAIRPLP
jgi:uncharacterized protein (UPF0210 family)